MLLCIHYRNVASSWDYMKLNSNFNNLFVIFYKLTHLNRNSKIWFTRTLHCTKVFRVVYINVCVVLVLHFEVHFWNVLPRYVKYFTSTDYISNNLSSFHNTCLFSHYTNLLIQLYTETLWASPWEHFSGVFGYRFQILNCFVSWPQRVIFFSGSAVFLR